MTGDPSHEERLDDDLAARSRAGDPKALAMLYRRHASPLLEYLERLVGERADAEDILHEAFLRVFEGRGRYSGRGRFRSWLYTIATRLGRDRLKQHRRRGELLAEAGDMLAPRGAPDPDAGVRHRELTQRVEIALADLPPSYALAFHLRVRESFSYDEIASISGEPTGTLRSRVHHTLRKIRQALGDPAQPSPEEEARPRKEDAHDRDPR